MGDKGSTIITSWIACSQEPAQSDHCQAAGQLPKRRKRKRQMSKRGNSRYNLKHPRHLVLPS